MLRVTKYLTLHITSKLSCQSRRGLETDKGSIAGTVSSAGGSSREELRDVGQQVLLPGAAGELRGRLGEDVEVGGDCQRQPDVTRGGGGGCCLRTGVAVTVMTLHTIASPVWSVTQTLPVLSRPNLSTELALGLAVTGPGNVLTVPRHGVAVLRVRRVPTPGAALRVWACLTLRSTLSTWVVVMVTMVMVTMC